ncbi:MAG: ice-binding family protein [Patescibacteria group bacterium]
MTGDIGVSPVAASYITGFALTLPVASAFSTSAKVTGKVYASDYANPTPLNLTTAILDMQTAYTDASGRAPTVTELGAGNIGGLTLAPGVYKWGTGLTIPTNVTLSGGANDVWIFVVAKNLDIASAKQVVLSGGAQASNIFWVVAGQTTIGTGAVFNGNILDKTAIVLNTGAKLNGRALAQTAVTLDSNVVTMPKKGASTPHTPTPTPLPAAPTSNGSQASDSAQTSGGARTADLAQTSREAQNSASSAAADTRAVLQARRNELMITLARLRAQETGQSSIQTMAVNLGERSRGDGVTTLQQFLITQNKGVAARALAKVGATAYFGPLTRAALVEFQGRVGISPALGNFGPITRSYLRAHY